MTATPAASPAGEADWPARRTRHDRDPSRLARLVKQIGRLDERAMTTTPAASRGW